MRTAIVETTEGRRVEVGYWWDRNLKLWTCYAVNPEGDACAESAYCANRSRLEVARSEAAANYVREPYYAGEADRT